MVQINFAQKTVNVKIVYYGPGMSGKTTNLEVVHQRAPDSNRGDLTSISTDGDRTLFFDFMPLDLGTVAGMRTQFQIYTVPGQVYYNSTRKLVLQGVDGVIFIADSSASMLQENIDSLRNLQENLVEYGKSLDTIPYVIQWNKRDLPDAMPVEELERALNPNGVPSFEGVANTGQGVFPTLKSLAARVLDTIHAQHGGQTAAPKSTPTATPEPSTKPMPASEPPVNSAGTGFYPTPTPAPAPPVQSAGTGFYAAPQPQAQPQQPAPAPPQQQFTAPMEPAPLAAAAHLGVPDPTPAQQTPMGEVPMQSSIPMAGAAPQQQIPIQPSPEMMTGGVPSGFPQPAAASPDALAKTQVHAPPQLAPEAAVPPPPGDGPHLRLMTQPPEHMAPHSAAPQAQPAPVAVATQEAQAAQRMPAPASAASLMKQPVADVPPPQSAGRSTPAPSAQDLASTRLRPRSAVRTPRSGGQRTAAFRTGVLVTLALAAGIILGSMVFSIL